MIHPLFKILKDGDIVLMRILHRDNEPKQIVRLKNVKYLPEDEQSPNTNWLEFEGEVLFTTQRVHKNDENFILYNCMAITEILNDFLIEKYKKDYNMFSPKEYQLTDEEYNLYELRYNDLLRN